MSIKVLQRPFKKEGYSHADFHFFTSDEMPEETDFETPSRSDEFVLFVMLEGVARGKINLQDFEISRQKIVLVAPNAVKQMIYKSADCRFIGFAFKSTFLVQLGLAKHTQDVFKILTDFQLPYLDLTEAEMELVLVYMRNIEVNYSRLNAHLFAEELIRTNFLAIFYEMGNIAYRQEKHFPHKATRKEAIVVKFGSLAMKHFRERKQLQFYANEIFVTPKYLTETVKEVTGKTAGELLDELVMREAKLMLEDPNFGISEVAIALNFNDQSFFGKYFRRHAGVSPREYRTNIITLKSPGIACNN